MKRASWLLRGPLVAAALLASVDVLAEVKIDGRLDEPQWQRARVFSDFRVTQPYTLGVPRHPTEVRMLGTPQGIVFGFRCTHPPGTPRQATQTPRDADNNGDRVNIYIDFNADAQVAYNITIALAGSLQDATLTNENQYSTDWDSDVEYAITQTEQEWFVEVLLPWTTASMKNADASRRTVGIAFDRVIGATQERSALQGVSFSRPRYVSEFPKVEIDQYPGSLLHFFPYASVANDLVGDEVDMKLGADIQWKPSGNFQLTAALNPDFGQVEADELVVNFDAIEVLFSDKRPFFAENQALFDVRVPETDSQRLTARDRLLYTRRIGGQRDDDPLQAADIDGAVKLNGNVGRLDYGLLSAVENDYGDDIGRAFAGTRLRYASGGMTLGYLGTWVDRPFLDRSAQVHTGDFIWRPNSQLMLQGQVIASLVDQLAEDTAGDGEILLAVYTPSPDWQHELGLTHYSGTLDFNDMGFQQRASVNRASYLISRRFRTFDPGDARAGVVWRVRPELRYNDSGERLGNYLGVFRESRQRSGSVFNTLLEVTGAGVDDLISRGNGTVQMDARLVALTQNYQSARIGKWRWFAAGSLLQEGNDDFAFEADSKLENFVRDDLSWSVRGVMRWSRDWLIWERDDLLASFERRRAILQSDLNWFPAARHELRVKLQWLAIDAHHPQPLRIGASGRLVESNDVVRPFEVNNFGLQIRYRWTFAPQSDLYFVYGRGGIAFEEGESRDGLGGLLESAAELRDSDQVLVKARYRF
ncbi:MAG TPA: DUF5916 domain-containing protein [Steroidobacteraceae bacterium]|nr:DUF5916 domain-containing protein [Steroidobacteraceae bacterium]